MECPTCSGTGVASAEEVALRAIDEVYSTQTGSKSRNVIARVTVGTTRLYLESVFAARAEALKR